MITLIEQGTNELQILGFSPCEDLGNMMSYKYGSC